MRFSDQFLDDLRDRVPISDVIGKHVAWDKRKTNVSRRDYWGCCPFHGEKTPSFHCEDGKGRYHCFGCGVSGDHFRFLTELEGLRFPEAVQQIADMAGVAMPAPDPESARREKVRANLHDVMEYATQFFQDNLQTAVGAPARAYLRDRGLTGRTIETFRLGFAPDSRNALKSHLAAKDVDKSQIEACGLVVHGAEIAVSYDRFRDRIMFPIPSSREKIIAFGGRAMSPDAPAKYLNSNETELFHKSNVLFNYTRARRAAQGADGAGTLIAVEGYMDVIALHQAGIENAVAPLGTALTPNQLELLWRVTPQPILCFDGDEAGQRAASRAADLALPLLQPGRSVRFAVLPDGKDPDDIVRHDGRAGFDAIISNARPLVETIWAREISSGVFDTPERRAELESKFRQITNQIADESVRRHYSQDMRDRLNGFFAASYGNQRGNNFNRGGSRFDNRNQAPRGGRASNASARYTVSEKLASSGMVRGHANLPQLRESVLACTIINHPHLVSTEFDDISNIEFDNSDLRQLWTSLLDAVAVNAALERDDLLERLAADGFGEVIGRMEAQVRRARIWTATIDAAGEDAREAYIQALSLHKRTRNLHWQKAEIERDISEATEAEDSETIDHLMAMLQEVQTEIVRLENQEAIIEGFGVLSGRVKSS